MTEPHSMRNLQKMHAAFYIGTGIWPILHRRSFEAVTGPKTDWWLVQTVGALVTAIGVTLWRAENEADAQTLAVSSAAALTAIDLYYTKRKVIRPVYRLDALAEIFLALAWILDKKKGSA